MWQSYMHLDRPPTQSWPPHGPPQGPPHGPPHGPPQGPPHGPPHGPPQGPPQGPPHGPPHASGRRSDSPTCFARGGSYEPDRPRPPRVSHGRVERAAARGLGRRPPPVWLVRHARQRARGEAGTAE